MKTNMKKWILTLACVFALGTTVSADNERPTTIDQLPAAAQQVIKQHFSTLKVALAKVESGLLEKSYDVIFTNGCKVEFGRDGQWTEISCKNSAVPAALVPAPIGKYLKATYPGVRITGIEKDRKEYEVQLSNGTEVTFNSKFQVIDIDN